MTQGRAAVGVAALLFLTSLVLRAIATFSLRQAAADCEAESVERAALLLEFTWLCDLACILVFGLVHAGYISLS
jgi:hypothetical protein